MVFLCGHKHTVINLKRLILRRMDILSYLIEFLQQSKEVGITGLGTFYKKKFPGRYDKEKQSFLPPSYVLQFNPQVTDADSFARFIAAKRKISVESAGYYISRFTEEIHQKIQTEQESVLTGIGRLFTDAATPGVLNFEAAKEINYGSEYFGLKPVDETETHDSQPAEDTAIWSATHTEVEEAPRTTNIETIQNTSVPEVENVELDEVKDDLKNTLQATEKPAVQAEVPSSVVEQHQQHPERFGHTPESETPPVKKYINLNDSFTKAPEVTAAPDFIKEQHAEHPNRFGHEPETETGSNTWIKVVIGILILLILAALAYYVKPEWFGQKQPEPVKELALIDSAKIKTDSIRLKNDSIAKTDSILKANQVAPKTDTLNTSIATMQKVTPATTTPAQPVKPAVTTYEVIVAAYRTTEKAEIYIAEMKKLGYNAKIAEMPGPWKKISIATFKTEQEAKEQAPILQKKLKGSGFYVQQINTTP